MDRLSLTNAQWQKIEPHCLGKKSDPSRTGGDARLFVEAILWIARTGSLWRDLPAATGTRCSSGFAIGSKPMFLNGYSMPFPMIPIWNTP